MRQSDIVGDKLAYMHNSKKLKGILSYRSLSAT
jgi:hypothetical protein